MSGVVKGVKKVFKKVGEAVKKVLSNKIVKGVLLAAAVYFTAGAAMGAFGASGSLVGDAIGAIGKTVGAISDGIGNVVSAITNTIGAGSAGTVEATQAAIDAASADAGFGAAGAAADTSADVMSQIAASNAADAAAAGSTVADAAGAASSVADAAAQSPGLIDGAAQASAPADSFGSASQPLLDQGTANIAKVANSVSMPDVPPPDMASVPMSGGNGIIDNALSWYKSLDAPGKMMLGSAVSGAVKGGFDMYAANQAADAREQQRQDYMRRTQVPDVSGYFVRPVNTGGIINSNTGGR